MHNARRTSNQTRCRRVVRELVVLLALAATSLDACAGSGDARDVADADSTTVERETRPPYRVVDVTGSGAIVGRITLESRERGDTTYSALDSAAAFCGSSRRVPFTFGRGDNVQDVVVWLADVRSGKDFPIERRYQLTNSDCMLEPRVQAAVEGGMLNVLNGDRSPHRTIFLRGADTVASVRETEAGQVVPTGKPLSHRGLVSVHSDRYPWSRAWIRVFDHPYFAVTNRDGIFTIDSVPPGEYTLEMWEPHLGARERKVRVDSAKDVKLDLTF